MVSFVDATSVTPREATDSTGRYDVVVPPDWTQGRTAFGGLAAAMLIRAVEALPAAAGVPIRSVDTAFIGPLPPGPATIAAEVLRRGKYLTHARAELTAAGADCLAASVHVVLGSQRTSQAVVTGPAPQRTEFADCLPLPYLEGLTPEFTRNLEFRYATGIPFSGSDSATVSGYCRHREPATGVPALAALVDAWPGAVMALLTAPAPASSVRWSMHRPDDHEVVGDAWHWYEAQTVVAGGGHATITAQLWRDDELVAWSEQLMAVFDKPQR